MLAPIRIKQPNTGIKALQLPIADKKKRVEENVVSDYNIKPKLRLQRQKKYTIPSGNITSYQQEYQYQTYFIAHPYKTASAGKSTGPVNNLSWRFVHFNIRHQITFLNGVAKCKQITWHQLKRYRWIINTQFHFAKKMFQIRIAQNNWSILRLSKNYPALLVYQQQSHMFKAFLPPS